MSNVRIFNLTENGFSVSYDGMVLSNTIVNYVVRYDSDDGSANITTSDTGVFIESNPIQTVYTVSVAYQTSGGLSNFTELRSTSE